MKSFRSPLAAFALASVIPWLAPRAALAQWAPTTPSISVNGTAEVRVAPDEAHVTVGVNVRHASLDMATEQNTLKVASVLNFLKGNGVAPADIQTDFVNIGPYYRNDGDTTPTYYTVHRNIGVRIRKIADFEKLLTGVLKNGATNIGGLEFRTTELRKHRDAARQLAIRAAKEKAEALTKELGTEVGRVQTISEASYGGGYWGGRHSFNQMAQNVIQNSGGGGGDEGDSGTLAVGQISVSASVHVVFALK